MKEDTFKELLHGFNDFASLIEYLQEDKNISRESIHSLENIERILDDISSEISNIEDFEGLTI